MRPPGRRLIIPSAPEGTPFFGGVVSGDASPNSLLPFFAFGVVADPLLFFSFFPTFFFAFSLPFGVEGSSAPSASSSPMNSGDGTLVHSSSASASSVGALRDESKKPFPSLFPTVFLEGAGAGDELSSGSVLSNGSAIPPSGSAQPALLSPTKMS